VVDNHIKHVVVVGAGFGGWYTALSLLNNVPDIRMTMIGSSRIPKLGVGESLSWDGPYNLKRLLGLDDDRIFMRSTGSIYKNAVHYENFNADGVASYHGKLFNLKIASLVKFFANFDYPDYHEPWNTEPDDFGTLDAWLYSYQQSPKDMDQMIAENCDAAHFARGPYAPNNSRNEYILRPNDGYSYHIDADKTVNFLRKLVKERHSKRFQEIDAVITDVGIDSSGSITGLTLDHGSTITGDLYCDLSGFRRLLISQVDTGTWLDLSEYSTDTAMVIPLKYTNPEEQMIGATKFSGHDYGWGFNINLYHRTGNGYVYKSSLATRDEIYRKFESQYGAGVEPTVLSWKPGYYTKSWHGNTVALGIAAGFIDPFDGNGVATHSRALENIIRLLQDPGHNISDRYNQLHKPIVEEVDFRLKLAFAFSRRSGAYWDLKREQAQKENLIGLLEDVVCRRLPDLDKRMTWNWQQGFVRMIAMTGLDISHFKLACPSTRDLDMAQAYWQYNQARNKYISETVWPNNYQWLKQNRFDGLTSDEIFGELNVPT